MPSIIRLGSNGADVKQWQTYLQGQGFTTLTPAGSFDKPTDTATRIWQGKHKLAVDGVVGPASWGLALGTPQSLEAKVKNGSAPTDAWAYAIAKQAAPSMPEAERQYVLAVARGEGYYGKGWTGDGANSNNWGAVQGKGDAGSFQHLDHHADGKPYTTAFKKYSTPQGGFLDMANILLKPNVKAAIAKGNLHDAVFAQHDNRYFELAPDKYLSAVLGNYAQLTANLSWPKLLGAAGLAVAGAGVVAGVVALVIVGAWALLKGRGGA